MTQKMAAANSDVGNHRQGCILTRSFLREAKSSNIHGNTISPVQQMSVQYHHLEQAALTALQAQVAEQCCVMFAEGHQTSCVAAILEAYCITIEYGTHVLMAKKKKTKQRVCKERQGAACEEQVRVSASKLESRQPGSTYP